MSHLDSASGKRLNSRKRGSIILLQKDPLDVMMGSHLCNLGGIGEEEGGSK